MKCRLNIQQRQKGIALVITLVMLAIVTVMAIVFLAVTRRERASVKVSEETAVAKDMADAALERVKTEALAIMNANGSRLHYDMLNSRAYFSRGKNLDDNNPLGDFSFVPGNPSPTNVAHTMYWPGMQRNDTDNYLRMLANLQYDPAVPVFVETNRNSPMEFRHYLDFNRNHQFETNFIGNGWAANFVKSTNFYGRYVGDPEWIGMLERPDLPHSETNRFIGRFAYLALPAGKSLDLNFIHNEVDGSGTLPANGPSDFSRGQGVGSWEINLAAFLRELNGNTYSWGALGVPGAYNLTLGPSGQYTASGDTFDDARSILGFRIRGPDGVSSRQNLLSLYETLSLPNPYDLPLPQQNFQQYEENFVEDYSRRAPLGQNGRVFYPPNQAAPEGTRDTVTVRGWPGSINTNAFTDLQQLFSVDTTSAGFVQRLTEPAILNAKPNSGRSSYDRYTFYRLAAQLGTDSTPATEGKIHLNFKNPVGVLTNLTERWTDPNHAENAVMFFTNAAELMWRASIDETITITNPTQVVAYRRPYGVYYRIGDTLVRTNFSLTNIQVYATNALTPGIVLNEYTPTIHRILQVAANIYDAMTNRADMLPTVFRPVFERSATNVYITRFLEVTNDAARLLTTTPWTYAEDALTNTTRTDSLTNYNLWGQHMVIGAKKGHPNFNELALSSRVEFSRKLLMRKNVATSTNIVATNQMFLVGMEQRWGIESWNSYSNLYRRSLVITGEVQSAIALRDTTNLNIAPVFYTNKTIGRLVTTTNNWRGRAMRTEPDRNMLVLVDANFDLINERSYNSNKPLGPGRFSDPNLETNFTQTLNLPPEFILYTTNRVRYWALDQATGRLVDFVSFDRLITTMDLREELRQNPSTAGTNNTERSYFQTNIIAANLTRGVANQLEVSLGNIEESQWGNYSTGSKDKQGSISKFRQFVGAPLRTGVDTNLTKPGEEAFIMQVPFTPTKQMIQRLSWQANDPLVHYMLGDLRRPRDDIRTFTGVGRLNSETNWNVGRRNIPIYHPWGQTEDPKDQFAFNMGLMDPGVRSSDDWQFPPYLTNSTHFPSIGMLGQVHRGTPWQTIYLKSFYRTNLQTGQIELFTDPSVWYNWAGSVGNHPIRDWRLLDCFTAAPNENAARGLLSVNQTNTAAWSAVLSGTIAARNTIGNGGLLPFINRGVDPNTSYEPGIITPSTAEIATIVQSINQARTNQLEVVPNPDPNANKNVPYIARFVTNSLVKRKPDYWRYMGEVLSAPALSVQSPFLNRHENQVKAVLTDRAVEFIPQQILGLLKRDEPRFVVYAFGQSLKPAERSLTTDPDFYHMCTNYQITGEVITKTTFRVEGRPMDPQDPLRPVIEKYEILPPVE